MFLRDIFERVDTFLETGGPVLLVIMLATFLLWLLIIDRYLYFWILHRLEVKKILKQWQGVENKKSWVAHKVRECMISQGVSQMGRGIPLLKTLVALCPLLGLLGTVTGMIRVFDFMAISGTGQARLMASGISMATIPTMAGMVASLSGLYFGSRLEKKVKIQSESLAESMDFI